MFRIYFKWILQKLGWLLLLTLGILLLGIGILYIETYSYDKSFLPPQKPAEIFLDTHFQDSVAEHTQKGDYFLMVKKYLEFMIVNGRDRYGRAHSPLFATTLDRRTGNAYGKDAPKAPKGIRERDRTWRGANPSNQSGLYSLLYQMTDITGDPRYAHEADKGIQWFFNHCQIEATGLMPWGEHMGWDFFKERPILWKFQCWIHELKGFNWDKVWELAPEPAAIFAKALWDHQVYAKEGDKAGEFSRHANAFIHWPFWGKGFPSHGGKYIEIWARAWNETGNEEFLIAIQTLLDYFDSVTSPKSGAIGYATKFPEHYSLGHNMGLAKSLYKVMDQLPDSMAVRMKAMADQTDRLYLSFDHDPTEGGKGFLKFAHVHTLKPGEYRWEHYGGEYWTKMWSSGYGAGNSIGTANSCLDRYFQTGIERYKELFMICAESYFYAVPPEPKKKILYPGNYSSAMGLMRKAYKLTGDQKYLERAIEYAEISIGAIMDDTSPLPKASSLDDHYEAITGANGFMSNLLGLWKDINQL